MGFLVAKTKTFTPCSLGVEFSLSTFVGEVGNTDLLSSGQISGDEVGISRDRPEISLEIG